MKNEVKKVPLVQVVGGKNNKLLDGNWILSKDMSNDGEIGIVQLKHVGKGEFLKKRFKFITKEKFSELGCTQLKEGDLLVSRMADPICRSCILPKLDFPTVTAVDVTIIRPDPNIANTAYLNNILNTGFIQHQAKKYAAGTTRIRISRKNLEKLIIPLPSVKEQEKIVSILEKTKEIRRWRKESDKLTNDYLNSVFLKMFGNPLINPKNWKTFSLEELCCEKRRITYGIVQPGNSVQFGVPIVRSLDLLDDYVSSTGLKKIDAKIEALSPRSRIKGGELLVSVRGTIGPVAIAPTELRGSNVSRGVAILDPISTVKVEYLFGLFRLPIFRKYLDSFAKGITLRQLNLITLRSLKIPKPPLELQEEYADFLAELKEIQKYQLSANEQIQYFLGRINQEAFGSKVLC
jgi:type I restriction enzyme, S subunit